MFVPLDVQHESPLGRFEHIKTIIYGTITKTIKIPNQYLCKTNPHYQSCQMALPPPVLAPALTPSRIPGSFLGLDVVSMSNYT